MVELEIGLMVGSWVFALTIYAMFRLILKKGREMERIEKERAARRVKEGRKAEF